MSTVKVSNCLALWSVHARFSICGYVFVYVHNVSKCKVCVCVLSQWVNIRSRALSLCNPTTLIKVFSRVCVCLCMCVHVKVRIHTRTYALSLCNPLTLINWNGKRYLECVCVCVCVCVRARIMNSSPCVSSSVFPLTSLMNLIAQSRTQINADGG